MLLPAGKGPGANVSAEHLYTGGDSLARRAGVAGGQLYRHHPLMIAVMQGVWFVQSGLNDAVQGLLIGLSQVILFSHELDLVLSLSMPYL